MSEISSIASGRPDEKGHVEFLEPHDWQQAVNIWESVGMVYPATSPEVSRRLVEDLVPGTVLAYKMGEKAVGVVLVGLKNSGNALLQRLAVLEEYRGRGVASALVKAAEGLYKERGIGESEVLVDPNNHWLLEWYRKRGYGVEPQHRYDAKGLLKPLEHDNTQEMDVDHIKIPDAVARHAFASMFERHMYFSTSVEGNDYSGYFPPEEVAELQQALAESSMPGVSNFRVAPNNFDNLYAPASRWQVIDAHEDEVTLRRWHALEGGPRASGSASKLLRIQDRVVDYEDPRAFNEVNLTADGYYIVHRVIRETHNSSVVPFQIQDGKFQHLDEETSNWLLRTLVNSASHLNVMWPPSKPTVRPSDLMTPEQKRELNRNEI